jgi:hypothetical protein
MIACIPGGLALAFVVKSPLPLVLTVAGLIFFAAK